MSRANNSTESTSVDIDFKFLQPHNHG